MVENRVLKIEEIWLSTNQLIQVLDKKGRLSDLQKRQLRELNGYLVTLHAILKMSSSLEIDGNFIYSGDVASTKVFSIMMEKKQIEVCQAAYHTIRITYQVLGKVYLPLNIPIEMKIGSLMGLI